MLFFSFFLTFISSLQTTLDPGDKLTFTYHESGIFICLNPKDFYGYLYSKSYSNRGWEVLANTGYWVVEFRSGGKLLVRNDNSVAKTLYYMTITQNGACDAYEYIANPYLGHYFLVSDEIFHNNLRRNLTMSSRENVCLFYIGPANYQIHIENTGPYDTVLYVNGDYYEDSTTITSETGFIIEYSTGLIAPDGYALVQVTDINYFDVSLDTGIKRAIKYDVLVSYGNTVGTAQLKDIAEYEIEHNEEEFMNSVLDSINELAVRRRKIIIYATLSVVGLILLISLCCCCIYRKCCCHVCSKCCNDQNEEEQSALQSDLISTNPGFIYGGMNYSMPNP